MIRSTIKNIVNECREHFGPLAHRGMVLTFGILAFFWYIFVYTLVKSYVEIFSIMMSDAWGVLLTLTIGTFGIFILGYVIHIIISWLINHN